MLVLPSAAEPLVGRAREAFTRPSFERFVLLCVGAIVTFGRRSVSRILWTTSSAAKGHPSSYHRLFSKARWSLLPLARVLAAMVLERVPADQSVLCAMDDHVIGRGGGSVYARARHCSAVGSTKGLMVWGHRWVVLAILVKFPFSSRYWALPVRARCIAIAKPTTVRNGGTRPHACWRVRCSRHCCTGSRTGGLLLLAMEL